MRAMVASDPLLDEHESLRAQIDAWIQAWLHRTETTAASTAMVLSSVQLGVPLTERLEKRLLLTRAQLEQRISRLSGSLAAAIAGLGGDTDTSQLERAVTDAIAQVGRADQDFGSKLAELDPLVTMYKRLKAAIDPA
jgi:hypothetical protein